MMKMVVRILVFGFKQLTILHQMVILETATISHSWFNWSATGKSSGNTITIPVHISFEWADGKIVREWHNYDPSEMMAELKWQLKVK